MKVVSIFDIPISKSHNYSVDRRPLLRKDFKYSNILSLNEAYLEPGGEAEKHSHFDGEEVFYFLEGIGEMVVDGNLVIVQPGFLIVIYPEESHLLRNIGRVPLKFITFLVQTKSSEKKH